MSIYQRHKQFVEAVTRMGYHPNYSPQNFKDAFEKIQEMSLLISRDNAKEYITWLEQVQAELARHGFQESFGNRLFYNQLEEEIRIITGKYLI